MISLRRPSAAAIDEYRTARLRDRPTGTPPFGEAEGFRRDEYRRRIGIGLDDFERARDGLLGWAAHRGAGVEVVPADEVATGQTVAIVTRQLGLWLLAACRVTEVVDDAASFGFTYATLPDHPECGQETFTVGLEGEDVYFEIVPVWRLEDPLVRLGAPVARWLQRRGTTAYLDALAEWTG